MIQIDVREVSKTQRFALGMRFYNAIRASTEDPEKKKYYLDLIQKEALQNDQIGTTPAD